MHVKYIYMHGYYYINVTASYMHNRLCMHYYRVQVYTLITVEFKMLNLILFIVFGVFMFNLTDAQHPGARVILTSKSLNYGNVQC